ncbi:hypothetical protein JAAARDRAFT_387592 [Jaapia argillacea MUCL 33604]|uniref:Uncharacterized protein n=1 Tax=Jaapia argillacea MUCL 33604 TaxID=933084 RepID=A0A067QJJ5_9AGAM|nr:hypothetical protein JAAARDRAFT_387592 [Jaapia argillacea MUCL 33604]
MIRQVLRGVAAKRVTFPALLSIMVPEERLQLATDERTAIMDDSDMHFISLLSVEPSKHQYKHRQRKDERGVRRVSLKWYDSKRSRESLFSRPESKLEKRLKLGVDLNGIEIR